MLPSNMTLKIKTGTVGYNNKILISNGKFILGKNEKVNLVVPAMKSYKTNSLVLEEPVISHKPQTTTHIGHHGHSDEKIALVLFLAGGFAIWNMFRSILESSS